MKHFIPAWYSNDKWWESTSVPFYQRRKYTDFDDMISLMSMHSKNNVDYRLIILSFSPYLRTYLHRYDLFEAHYWSVFDEIQGTGHQTPQAIDYRDLDWPDETEFIFTPFQIEALTGENTHSIIHFSQEGYLMWIEDFENNIIKRRFVFDDRGFISAVRTYTETGEKDTKHYFTKQGEEVFQEDLVNKTVTIHEQFQSRFEQTSYPTMADLIEEKFKSFVEKEIGKDDVVIVASDERHNTVMANTIKEATLCYSIFKERNPQITLDLFESISKAQYCLVDTIDNQRKIQAYCNQYKSHLRPFRVTPFDANNLPNKSSQLYETYIGVWVDQLSESNLKLILSTLFQYIQHNNNYKLKLLTKSENALPQWVKEEILHLNELYNTEKQGISEEIQDILANEIDSKKESAIEIASVPYEDDYIRAIANLRVIVDVSNEPELFLQICSMGAGIPQINASQTDYVKHKQNGWIVEHPSQIIPALDYFLLHLKNWNFSFAYSMRLVREFSSINLIHQINQLFEGDSTHAK